MLTGTLAKALSAGLILAVVVAGLMTKLYLGKRDQLAVEQRARAQADALVFEYAKIAKAEERHRKYLEGVRLALQQDIAALAEEETKTVTKIREVLREVDCAREPMPADVVGLLKCSARGDCPGEALPIDPG